MKIMSYYGTDLRYHYTLTPSSRTLCGHDGGYATYNKEKNEINCTELGKDTKLKRYDPRNAHLFFKDGKISVTQKHLNLHLIPYGYQKNTFDVFINGQYAPNVHKLFMGFNSLLARMVDSKKQVWGCPHHVSHAYSGHIQSPFDKCAVLSTDGGSHQGCFLFGSFDEYSQLKYETFHYAPGVNYVSFNWTGKHLKSLQTLIPVNRNTLPKELVEIEPEWSWDLAGKLMGLSSYGDLDEELIDILYNFFNCEPDPEDQTENYFHNSSYDPEFEHLILDNALEKTRGWIDTYFDSNKKWIKNYKEIWKKITDKDAANKIFTDYAACSQEAMERWYLDFLRRPNIKKIIDQNDGNLLMVGGCALNVLVNQRIRDELGINVWVPPHCDDSGHAIGQLSHYLYTNKIIDPQQKFDLTYKGSPLIDSEDLIRHHIRKRFRPVELNEIVSKIENGNIIGLITGRSEMGPRALGHRSLICDPSFPNMKQILNEKVKHREWFRPFAPMCRLEDVKKYFDNKHNFGDMSYMSFAIGVKEKYKKVFPAITHVDGTARLQTIRKDNLETKLVYDILSRMTKEKMLLNTSLNFNLDQRPTSTLNSIQDAILGLERTGMDYVLLEYDDQLWLSTEEAKRGL